MAQGATFAFAAPAKYSKALTREMLLVCGPLSSRLYVAMNLFGAMQWQAYPSASQTVSELSAIGAPTRTLWVTLGVFYSLLVIAFAWGMWLSARHNRPLRVAGIAMIVYGVVSLAWPLAPMHLRETLAAGGGTLSDTMHLTLAAVTVPLMLTEFHQLRARSNPTVALIAIARKMIVAIYYILRDRVHYKELGADYVPNDQPERRAQRLIRQLNVLGFSVQVATVPEPA